MGASEPVVTCLINFLLLGEILPTSVYATLLPIIGGVAIASAKELSFTYLALAAAMLSNVSSSARGVLSKKTMSGKKIGENLDAQNLYAVLTGLSTLICIPCSWKGQPSNTRCRKHNKTCSYHRCISCCLQDTYEYWINHWIHYCYCWNSSLLPCYER